jgi:hypothetical protein
MTKMKGRKADFSRIKLKTIIKPVYFDSNKLVMILISAGQKVCKKRKVKWRDNKFNQKYFVGFTSCNFLL